VLAQENANGEVLWALTDHQGSVRVLLDNQGNVVNNITYDAFGNITLETHSQVNFRFSYTGREFDSETGLYNYRSRYYDPAVGQFINEDTIGFAGGDSNLYRYVANSPVNYIDPSGFCRVGSLGDQSTLVAGDIAGEPGVDIGDLIKGAAALIVGGIGAPIGAISSILEGDSDDDDDDDDVLFRGDLRPPDVIKSEGFQPKNPNGNLSLEDHVDYVDPDNSQWVSTSTDEQSAAAFGTESDSNPPFETTYGWVYRLNRPPGGVNVNDAMGISSPEAEIAFPGGIPPQYVEGYKKILGENQDGSYVLDTYRNINE
jgi:RHS repeat-associated protein